MTATVIHGDCLEALKLMEADSVDSIVSDPPAGITFMGKSWDTNKGSRQAWVAWMESVATEAIRVMKPGGYALVWALPRTSHWTGWAWENAGWEVRDKLVHLFGCLSEDTEILINGRWEPYQKVAKNVLKHGTGGINIDGCRIGFASDADKASAFPGGKLTSHGKGALAGPGAAQEVNRSGFVAEQSAQGRWPANVILDEEAAALLDEQTGTLTSGKASAAGHRRKDSMGATGGAALGGNADGSLRAEENAGVLYGDSGGPSRFFYTAKASRSERTHGGTVENKHPTVKAISLMRYLVRLITPPNGTVLDPFTGSGSTGVGAILEGFNFVGCEMEIESVETARERLKTATLVVTGGIKNPWEDGPEVAAPASASPAASEPTSLESLFDFDG